MICRSAAGRTIWSLALDGEGRQDGTRVQSSAEYVVSRTLERADWNNPVILRDAARDVAARDVAARKRENGNDA
jgi:hypothetical protein